MNVSIQDPYKELLDRFITENQDYSEYRENFVCDFASMEDVISYQPDWWEERYEDMSSQDILHEWEERNHTLVVPFEGRYLVFGNVGL